MAEPYIGQITMVGFNFAPRGWALCNGQLLSISQNAALYALIGTTYGGNGQTTFGLPNLQSRLPIHQGTGGGLATYQIGQTSGAEHATLQTSNLPSHHHTLSQANTKLQIGANSAAATSNTPVANTLGVTANATYTNAAVNSGLHGGTVLFGPGSATDLQGGNQSMTTLPPYLCVNFIMAIVGIFPSRN